MAETGYINYGTTQSDVPAELKVYYNIVSRTPESVTIDIDVGVHYSGTPSSNGCWVKVAGKSLPCNPNHIGGQRYWYASSQANRRSAYWKQIVLPAEAANTSVSLSVGFSNKAYEAGTYQYNNFTLTIPSGNTNAYWVDPVCSVSPSGIFGENTKALSVSWSGAQNDQAGQILYKTELWKNGILKNSFGGSGTTSTTVSVNITDDFPGTEYYFRTYCKDENADNWVFGTQSSTVAKNRFASFSSFKNTTSKTTPGGTYKITCTYNPPSNSNGNTNFTYGLSAKLLNTGRSEYSLTVYGVTSARLAVSPFTITVWNGSGSTPTGMYIKQSEVKSIFDTYNSSIYVGRIRLTLTCSNAYGSSGSALTDSHVTWWYTPGKLTEPAYSASSYYILPDSTDPVFLINRRAITWTWDPVSDPMGDAVTYLIYTKTDNNSWKQVASTNSASYTTPIANLSRPETYQMKVIAQFVNGSTSPEAVGPEITLHYYNEPKLTASILDRGQDTVTIKTSIDPSSSLPNPIGSITLTYGGPVDSVTTASSEPPFRKFFEEQKILTGLAETTAGTVNLSYKDSVMSAVLGTSTVMSASVKVPLWVPLLTIREKGIGINAIAGDFADLIAKGTVSIYGGDASGQADGSITLATGFSAPINLYMGAYLDSAGELRAAQDLGYKKGIVQIQFTSSSSSRTPVRWRFLSTNKVTAKDEVLVNPSATPWYDLIDTELEGVDSMVLANKLSHYVARQNVSRGSIYSVRDAGAIRPTSSSGYLLFPFTTTYGNDDYFTIEATFGWNTNDDVPAKMYAYTGCNSNSYATKCLILGSQVGSWGRCAVVQNTSSGIYYFQLNTTAYNFVGNAFINTDLIHATGTPLPDPAASGRYAPILATSLSGYTTVSTGNTTFK